MQLKFDRNKNFHPEIYYFKLINPDGMNIASGSFLCNTDVIKEGNARLCLSEEFRTYIKNLPED